MLDALNTAPDPLAFLLAVVEKRLAPGATILDVDVVPRLGGVALWFREERADGSVADYFIALPNLETAPAEIVAEMPVEEQAAEDDDGPDALFGGSCGFMVAAYADGRDDIVSVEPWVPPAAIRPVLRQVTPWISRAAVNRAHANATRARKPPAVIRRPVSTRSGRRRAVRRGPSRARSPARPRGSHPAAVAA